MLNGIRRAQRESADLVLEYDVLPRRFGKYIFSPAEVEVADLIARNSGITNAELARILCKTSSACSQLVRKLREKGIVHQTRNEENGRQLKLELTEEGAEIFREYAAFKRSCLERTMRSLVHFSEEELRMVLAVQRTLIESYRDEMRGSWKCFKWK